MYSVDQFRGAMHQIETIIKNIYYGFSMDTFFVRLDANVDLDCRANEFLKTVSFEINIIKPVQFKIELSCSQACAPQVILYRLGQSMQFEKVKSIDSFSVKKVIEIAVPFSDLEIKKGDEVQLAVCVKKDCRELENWPKGGIIVFKAPDEDYLASSWFV
jgi:hypothetical protein